MKMEITYGKLFVVFFLVFVGLFFTVNTAYAGDGGGSAPPENLGYKFIEPLPIIGDRLTSNGSGTLLIQYLGGMYIIILGASAILALFMLVVGGIQYTYVALSPSAKNDAKERIKNALFGLLIVLGAYLILKTINPDLVSPSLVVEKIEVTGNNSGILGWFGLGGVGGDVKNKPVDPGILIGKPGIYVPWNSEREQAVRDRLLAEGKIRINNPNACGTTGQTSGCTDVGGLTNGTIDQVIAFNKECNCNVVISGGSEGGHKTHDKGVYAYRSVDISRTKSGAGLDAYIMGSNKQNKRSGGCPVNSNWDAYTVNGGIYCDENQAHWHVIYP